MKVYVLSLQDLETKEIIMLRGFLNEDEGRKYAHENLTFKQGKEVYFFAEIPIDAPKDKIIPKVMAKTTEEWRAGFEFAIRCLWDHSEYHVNKKENSVEKLLLSTKSLIEFNSFWPKESEES